MPFDAVAATLGATPYQVALSDGRHGWTGDTPSAGDSGPDPHAQLLAALGTCTAITVKMYAERKGWPLTDVQVALRYGDDHRDGDAKIERQVALTGELDGEQRERLLQIANACPIHKLLSGEIQITTALA
ncbi:OsmC family protein [Andreprevotia chitinilytica]|uniref:OsmC family protein n=1 Tax=Andreprevotia chitinilytica TaxID=396808 RepID=UPI00054FD066|nr:OsmC family protein [Andreprevotia chitinilytica]